MHLLSNPPKRIAGSYSSHIFQDWTQSANAAGMQNTVPELFYFSVREVRVLPHVPPRYSADGSWRPPRSHHHHYELPPHPQGGYHNETAYAYQVPANAIIEYRANLDQTPGVNLYRTACLYYSHGVIWCVNYDPTQHDISTGRDVDGDDSSGGEDADGEEVDITNYDWEMLQFHHFPGGVSWVDYAVGQDHIYATRPDQRWQSRLLPAGYFPDANHRNVANTTSPYGSLHGNLAILIGLVALQADPNVRGAVHHNLAHCIRRPNSWRRSSQPFAAGWHNGRGIIVRVYTNAVTHMLAQAYENTPLFD